MQITISDSIGKVLNLWATSRGTDAGKVANDVLAIACMNFLDGNSAALKNVQASVTPTIEGQKNA